MKKMKKSMGLLVAAFVFCFAFAVTAKVDAAEVKAKLESVTDESQLNAKVQAVSTGSFDITYMSPTKSDVGISVNQSYADSSYRTQIGLFDAAGNLLQTTECISYASFTSLKTNKVYIYRARTVQADYTKGVYTPVTAWSGAKAFSTINFKGNKLNTRGFWLKGPKVTGVKNYKVYISKKTNSGFKKVKTIKPGKKVKFTKFKKQAFKLNTYYYIRIVPVLKSKVACKDFSTTNGLYDFRYYSYRTYR